MIWEFLPTWSLDFLVAIGIGVILLIFIWVFMIITDSLTGDRF